MRWEESFLELTSPCSIWVSAQGEKSFISKNIVLRVKLLVEKIEASGSKTMLPLFSTV